MFFAVRPRPRGQGAGEAMPARARAHHREIIFFLNSIGKCVAISLERFACEDKLVKAKK
jgi:hypothetical protein